MGDFYFLLLQRPLVKHSDKKLLKSFFELRARNGLYLGELWELELPGVLQ